MKGKNIIDLPKSFNNKLLLKVEEQDFIIEDNKKDEKSLYLSGNNFLEEKFRLRIFRTNEEIFLDKNNLFNNDNDKNYNSLIPIDSYPKKFFFDLEKIKELFYLAFPTTLFFLCMFLQETINLLFIGYLIIDTKEKEESLNALGISHIYINCLIISIISGLMSGFDTLGSNAYGAKYYKLMGVYLQKAQIISFLILLCLLVFHYFFAVKIISIFITNNNILEKIAKYLNLLFLFCISDIQFSLNFRYLNVIDKSHYNLIFLFITLILHPLWCHIFMNIYGEKIGVIEGGAISLILSQTLNMIMGTIYIYLIKPLPDSIFCYNKSVFKGWKNYLKISIPSALLMCAEWWAFEILSLVASSISEEDFTIHVCALNIFLICFTISLGFGISLTILAGREFGCKNLSSAMHFFKLAFFFGIIMIICLTIFIYCIKDLLFESLIGDKSLSSKYENILFLLNFTLIFDLIQYLFSSFFRGIGKQLYALIISFFNYYIFQFGLALYFTKIKDMKIFGIWLSIFLGSIFSCVIYVLVFFNLNLKEIIKETQHRLKDDEKIVEEEI